MNVKTLQRSFAAGEITPELYARLDLVNHQTGLARARNFWILPHGPAQNRPGFGYVLETKNSSKRSRLIPFEFSTEQTFAIEFGDQYIRFHTNGATLLESLTSILYGVTNGSPGIVTNSAGPDAPVDGDWIYFAGMNGMDELNNRFVQVTGAIGGQFNLASIYGGAPIDTTNYTPYVSGGTMSRVYEVATPYLEADLFDLHFVQSEDVLTITHPSYAPRELRRLSATDWELTEISFVPTIGTPASPPTVAATTVGGTNVNHSYLYTAVSAALEESLPSGEANDDADLTIAGNFVTVTCGGVSGAVRYNVYKLSGGLYGYIGSVEDGVGFNQLIDRNITPDISRTPPALVNPFVGAGNYPGAVGYHEQRRCFGGTTNQPQNFWATVSATENNLSYSIPQRDNDSVQFRIRGRQVNRIRHILSLDELFLLTSGGEFRVTTANTDILTPTSAAPKQFAGEGASNVQPVIAKSSAIYTHDSGTSWLELKYARSSDGASTLAVTDISVMAPHLFAEYQTVDMTFAKKPYPMAWGVRSDGRLIGLTYMPEHRVAAFHQHDTATLELLGGVEVANHSFIESVCCVKEGSEWPLYVVVRRYVNGRDVRNVERMHSRQLLFAERAKFLDSSLTYEGAATGVITGLWHLEGMRVRALVDGNEITGLTVENGSVTLPDGITGQIIHIGFPVEADFQTLPLAIEMPAGGTGVDKNINGVYLRLFDSGGFKIGPSFEPEMMTEFIERLSENYGEPPALMNGLKEITLFPEWSLDASVCIRHTSPLPVTITGLTIETALGS